MSLSLCLYPNERWWGGTVQDGVCMPFGISHYQRDLRRDLEGNQASSLLLTNQGRFRWSDEPFGIEFDSRDLIVVGAGLYVEEGLSDLRGAYRETSWQHFPPQAAIPDPVAFAAPQFNTLMETGYVPTQCRVLPYAQAILDGGWSEDDRDWRFRPGSQFRKVVFPLGEWISGEGECFLGPCEAVGDAPLGRLPWFRSSK